MPQGIFNNISSNQYQFDIKWDFPFLKFMKQKIKE